LYSILIELNIHMKLHIVELIQMCSDETWSKVWICKHLPDVYAV
jgi:hypothetical protein